MKYRIVILATLAATTAYAATDHTSKYSDEVHRQIKSLSDEDIGELQRGGGWGLAKPAELNGLPGPVHVLEMAEEIQLSDEQEAAIRQLYNDMKAEAIRLGEQFIRLEAELNNAFAKKTISAATLSDAVRDIEKTRAELRIVHLSAHLKTPEILSQNQLDLYNQLRGYASDDPCQNIPQGHSEKMWKKHNGCE